MDLVEEASIQALLDGVSAVDTNILPVGGGFGLGASLAFTQGRERRRVRRRVNGKRKKGDLRVWRGVLGIDAG